MTDKLFITESTILDSPTIEEKVNNTFTKTMANVNEFKESYYG